MGYSFRLVAHVHLFADRIIHTTAFVKPVVAHWQAREIAQWVHHEGSIRRSIAPWANALTTELHLALTIIMTNSQWLINQCALRVSLKSSTRKAKEWTYSRREGARCSSVVERPLMVRWVVRSIPHGERIEIFLVEAVFHGWCNKGHSMYYPVWGMVNIKYILIVNIKNIMNV